MSSGQPVSAFWQKFFLKSADVQQTKLEDEMVLLNVETGSYYTLNRVGVVTWELLTGEYPLEHIASTLCQRFDVTDEIARQDLAALVASLSQEQLIEERIPGNRAEKSEKTG